MGHCGLLRALWTTVLVCTVLANTEQKRSITVEDCVGTRRIVVERFGQVLPIQLSPDGSRLAFVVKAPNIKTNHNDYLLYIRDLIHLEPRENGKLVLQADRISEIKWIGSDQLMARVATKSKTGIESELDIIDAVTASLRELRFPVPVEDVSVSADGKVVAFSSLSPLAAPPSGSFSKEQIGDERGFPIIFGKGLGAPNQWPREYNIYLGKISTSGKIEASKLYFRGPGNAARRPSLLSIQDLRLSPDGKYLLLKYIAHSVPDLWSDHPLVKELSGLGTRGESLLLSLYDIATEQLRLAFSYPGALITASWAQDSHAYSVISPSPFGSPEEKKETNEALTFGRLFYYLLRFNHVFSVDVKNGTATPVVRRDSGEPGYFKFLFDVPLWWEKSDEMIVRTGDNTIATMRLSGGTWTEGARFELPQDNFFRSLSASDGRVLVGVSQSTTIPPDLFVRDLTTGKTSLLTDLNPEYRHIALGEVERIAWANRFGSKCTGKLITPTGYEPGKKYPLVLMANYTDDDYFISDSLYTTAFAPQSLANAGFVVLMSQYPREDKFSRDEFPGDMGQAYNWMSMMETAIDLLVEKGIADRDRVGIVGFSRTSWLTDLMLTHSKYKIKAASSADSGIYTYGGYFRYNRSLQLLRGDDTQIGGPPQGSTRKYWLEYAAPFNAERVTAPLLMEYTGTADHGLEFFVALNRLGKPVELFRYPKGEHPLNSPFERVASLKRNVDWFRFWIQAYEDGAPEYDPDQYLRWRRLRDQQVWNEKMSEEGKDPSIEFLRQTSSGAITAPRDRAPAALAQP